MRGTPRFADVITVTVAELLELPGPSLLLLARHGTLGALGEQVSRYPTDAAVEAPSNILDTSHYDKEPSLYSGARAQVPGLMKNGVPKDELETSVGMTAQT